MTLKILNLYAGIGGNRKLWGEDIMVTAIENNPKIAKKYQSLFPKDEVIVTDAHKYLLDHYKEFDFIWSSPPCQSHSGMNNFLNPQGIVRYPNMNLWQEILFLRHFCKCKWVIENTKSYYEPFLEPKQIGRHFFWSNFNLTQFKGKKADIGTFNRDASVFAQKMNKKNQAERNCVEPELGLHIFKLAFKEPQKKLEL
jgi:DNA (cytosine-5)-methyltransferase 1